jgi:hypothetical protein
MNSGSFAAIDRLLIDGNNLLHRVAGGVGPGALRGLLARLRGALPAQVNAIVMLDGHSAPGTGRSQRIAPNLEIRHSGSFSADEALLKLVSEWPAGTTLVSDDRALRDKAMSLGAHTERLAWLEMVLGQAASAPGIGGGNRGQSATQHSEADGPERAPWQPGRGATRKRGNPRRTRRHS